MLRLNHKNLEFWQKAIGFVSQVYLLTKNYPREEQLAFQVNCEEHQFQLSQTLLKGPHKKVK